MAEEVYREIYLFTRRRVPPIDIVYGSALPVTLKLMDYTIPTEATVMVYASVDREKVYQQAGTASGNTVQFTPGYGFFAPGRNDLQIAINGNKIPLALAVNCEALLPEISDPTSTPEAVRPMVEEAREILKETKAVAVKTPYVGDNGNWYVWDTATGAFQDSGKPSKGDKGDAFTYADFTEEQLAGLKGPKGDAFTYADFTAEQLAGLKGPKGDAFEYSDFTPAQLAALKGDPGTPATVTSTETVYQAGTSGTEAPTGTWSETVPTVPQGQYLWTRVTTQFNTGDPVISYSVSRFGVDGSGSVVSVNGVGPDNSGNIQLTASNIPAGNDQTVGGKLEALDTGVSNAASAASAAASAAQTAQTTAEGAASAAQIAQEAANSAATAAAGKQEKITATGLLKGTGSAVEEAQAGVDYQAPLTAGVNYQTPLVAGTDYQAPLTATQLSTLSTLYAMLTGADGFAAGAGSHNCFYRGKNLGTSVTSAQWSAISTGKFDDLYIGDYWVINSVNWRIAAFDYYYNTGDTACTTHHVVIVPDTSLYTAKMNDAATAAGAYVGSKMYTANLASAKTTINSAFGAAHILNHRNILKNAVSGNFETGDSWYDSAVELMTEANVFGCFIYANCRQGENWATRSQLDRSQYPLFGYRPDLISNGSTYWLRDVAYEASFCMVESKGTSGNKAANSTLGVRPAFCIKG